MSRLFHLPITKNLKTTNYYYNRKGHRHSVKGTADITDIAKINGYKFCFKKISYRDLLYNGQIIKKGESCPQEYKNCGIIDTLDQQLCIKNSENCPLYDVGIGKLDDTDNYIYVEDLIFIIVKIIIIINSFFIIIRFISI